MTHLTVFPIFQSIIFRIRSRLSSCFIFLNKEAQVGAGQGIQAAGQDRIRNPNLGCLFVFECFLPSKIFAVDLLFDDITVR